MKDKVQKVATEEMVENWVNLEDIAKYLSVSNNTIYNWIKGGKLLYNKDSKRVQIKDIKS